MNQKSSRQIGCEEEDRALKHFLDSGWKLLRRNYRKPTGEIDLIFMDEKETVVFMEVKYRSSPSYGDGSYSVQRDKQSRLIRTACRYIKENHLRDRSFRFDVCALSPKNLEHIPNAFPAEGYNI